jgi:hypothetical protein
VTDLQHLERNEVTTSDCLSAIRMEVAGDITDPGAYDLSRRAQHMISPSLVSDGLLRLLPRLPAKLRAGIF